MKTKKSNNKEVAVQLENAINSTKESLINANNFALKQTEEIITESLNVSKRWQDVTSEALNGGFKLMENQQKLAFGALDTFKNQFVQGKDRFSKIFA